MAPIQISATLPSLPSDWSAEKDFKAVAGVSASQNRAIEPVGPHFLAHARRKRHQRTFSEDERIQAATTAKKVETEDIKMEDKEKELDETKDKEKEKEKDVKETSTKEVKGENRDWKRNGA